MAEFTVHGPFKLDTGKQKAGGKILKVDQFWDSSKKLSRLRSRIGVYVFAIKPSGKKTYTPFYVGKATKKYEQEVFTDHKIRKYERGLNHFIRGYGVLFFIEHPPTRPNLKQIKEVERYLIMMGFAVNEKIENGIGAKLPDWAIQGVIRGGGKNPSNASKCITKMFAVKSKKGV